MKYGLWQYVKSHFNYTKASKVKNLMLRVCVAFLLALALNFVPTFVSHAAIPTYSVTTAGGSEILYSDQLTCNSRCWESSNVTIKLYQDAHIGGTVELQQEGVTLDLNGHIFTNDGMGRLITVNAGKSFTLTDSDPSAEHYYKVRSNGSWELTTEAALIANAVPYSELNAIPTEGTVIKLAGGALYGGRVSDKSCAGVYVDAKASFTMNGGAIIGCQALNDNNKGGCAGAIYASRDGEELSTVNLSAGVIAGNYAEKQAGGVQSSGDLYISGTDISFNVSDDKGGGVCIVINNLTMTSGRIAFNKVDEIGGGIYVGTNTNCVISGGSIINNIAKKGGGINIAKDTTVTLTGTAKIYGNVIKESDQEVKQDLRFLLNAALTGEGKDLNADCGPIYVTTVVIPSAEAPVTFAKFAAANKFAVAEPEYGVVTSEGTTALAVISFDNRFGGKYSYTGSEEGYTQYSALTEGTEYTVYGDTKYTFAGWYTGVDGTGTKLSGTDFTATTYYAKWTNNGTTVITTPIDLTNVEGNASGDGWSWNGNNRTLSLNGLTLDLTNATNSNALYLPAGSNIFLKAGSVNNIIYNSRNQYATAICAEGSLVIWSSGTLNVVSSAATASYGIVAKENLNIRRGAILNVTASTKALVSESGNINLESVDVVTVNVTRTADKAISAQNITIKAGTTLKVSGGLYGLYATESIKASNKITVEINNGAENGVGIYCEGADGITLTDADVTVKMEGAGSLYGIYSQVGPINIAGGNITATFDVASTTDDGRDNISGMGGVIISEGTTAPAITVSGGDHGIMAGNVATPGKELNISCGTINASACNTALWSSGNMVISGGTVTATATGTSGNDYAINSQAGNVIISGSETEVTATGGEYGICSKVGSFSITDAKLTAKGTDYAIYAKTDFTLDGAAKIYAYPKVEAGNNIGDKADHFYTVDRANEMANGTSNVLTSSDSGEEPQPIEIALVKYTASFTGLTGSEASQETAGYVARPVSQPAAEEGYTFVGWSTTEPSADSSAYVFNFEQSYMAFIREDTTFYPVWVANTKAVSDCSGKVVDSDSTPISDAWVTAFGVGGTYGNTATDENGEFTFKNLPAGIYNIQIVDMESGKFFISTITSPADPASVPEYKMPAEDVSIMTMLLGQNACYTVVDGLDTLVKAVGAEETGNSVFVDFCISEWGADEESEIAIEDIAVGKILSFFSVDISKTVNEGDSVAITSTSNVLTLIVPYDASKIGISVYRYHDGTAEALSKKRTAMDVPKDGCYYVDFENDLVYIYTSKFSTYAIGYNEIARAYYIEKEKTTNGTVSVCETMPAGDSVKIMVEADEGYVLDTLTVVDAYGAKVSVNTVKEGESYTFTMASSDVTVSASFKKEEEPETEFVNNFKDVSESAYYYKAVCWAAENGITSGKTETEFDPNGSCTRAQFVTFLWRAAGSPVVDYAMQFSDVAEDKYYTEAIRWAVAEGITNGTSETTFSPNTVVTRAQAVTFLWRYNGSIAFTNMTANGAAESPFSDVSNRAYYYNAVLWAKAQGITSGKTETTFAPDNICTRAHVVTFIYNNFVK